MIRFAIAFLIAFTSNAFAAASFCTWDWETLPTATDQNDPSDIWYQGNCFEKALGDLNALTLGTYYYTAYTFTGGVLKFSSGTIDLIAE